MAARPRTPSSSFVIDCEEDRTLGAVLVGMLREAGAEPRRTVSRWPEVEVGPVRDAPLGLLDATDNLRLM